MAGRWNEDDREERPWDPQRRYDQYGLNDEAGDRPRYGGREERVFGERESGVSYGRAREDGGQRGRQDYRSDHRGGGRNWQDPDYGGVSPAMKRGDYETGYRAAGPRFSNQDYTRGGRFYGDDGRGRIYREEYRSGAPRHGDAPPRFGDREADARWKRELNRPTARGTYSGGTGGYDYERGYGDGGRSEGGSDFEDRARDAGDFFRRTGRRISNWFSDVAGEGAYDNGGYGEDRFERGHRGVGPKGYQRSDDRISDEVHQRLTDDAWLDASEINVAVSGGEVTLSGSVDSREAKHRAERVVEDLSGVKHVQNNLRIERAGLRTATDRYGDGVGNARLHGEPPEPTISDHAMSTSANTSSTTSRKN